MRRGMQWVFASIALAAWLSALSARAQTSGVEAQRAFDAGQQAFDTSDYVTALEHFQRSQALAPRPRTLLRIAQTAEADGQVARALETYRAYLVVYPKDPSRPTIEGRIAKLSGKAPALPPAAVAPAPAPAAPAAPSPPTAAALSVGGLGNAPASRWSADDEDWFRTNRGFRIAGRIMVAVGGLAILAGLATGKKEYGDEYDSYASYSEAAARAILAGTALYSLGSLTWGASTLRGTNELRRRGVSISKVASVLTVVGIFGPPVQWIAGPMAGANMRRAHAETLQGAPRSAADYLPTLQYRVSF
jgi:tetratricopeptide (TPR) repeat protein